MSGEDEVEYNYESGGEYEYGSDNNNDADEENEENNIGVEIENTFYEAEDFKSSNAPQAVKLFEKVVQLEEEHSLQKWQFKALLNLVVLYTKMGDAKSSRTFHKLLSQINTVNRNESNDAINEILNNTNPSNELELFDSVIAYLKSSKNDRLLFSTQIKYTRKLLSLLTPSSPPADQENIESLLNELKSSSSSSSSSALIEVCSLQISLYSRVHDSARLLQLQPIVKNLLESSATCDIRIMASVHEDLGVCLLDQESGDYAAACLELYSAFRAHMEIGNSSKAKYCLSCLAVACMLNVNDVGRIDPFAGQETIMYRSDEGIQLLIQIKASYEESNLVLFKSLLSRYQRINEHLAHQLNSLCDRIRETSLERLIVSYSSVTFEKLARAINLPSTDGIEPLLVKMILQGRFKGHHCRIDQVRGVLVISRLAKQDDDDDKRQKRLLLKKKIDDSMSIMTNYCF